MIGGEFTHDVHVTRTDERRRLLGRLGGRVVHPIFARQRPRNRVRVA